MGIKGRNDGKKREISLELATILVRAHLQSRLFPQSLAQTCRRLPAVQGSLATPTRVYAAVQCHPALAQTVEAVSPAHRLAAVPWVSNQT